MKTYIFCCEYSVTIKGVSLIDITHCGIQALNDIEAWRDIAKEVNTVCRSEKKTARKITLVTIQDGVSE